MDDIKKKFLYLLLALVFLISLAWLFIPSHIPYIKTIWLLMSKPVFLSRLLYLGIFFFAVFFLSVRLLKSGPI
jgi:hypothetical protein